jgi:hypothetical protein
LVRETISAHRKAPKNAQHMSTKLAKLVNRKLFKFSVRLSARSAVSSTENCSSSRLDFLRNPKIRPRGREKGAESVSRNGFQGFGVQNNYFELETIIWNPAQFVKRFFEVRRCRKSMKFSQIVGNLIKTLAQRPCFKEELVRSRSTEWF